MSKIFLSRNHSTGLSMIELMVAMVIGLILIGGTASIYLASKQSYVEVERMARMTQNSRFALQMTSEALQQAGYTGELPVGNIVKDTNLNLISGTDCSGTAAAYDIGNYLFAATSNSGGGAFGCVTDAVPNTSVLMIKNVRPMKLMDSNSDGTIDSPEAITGTNTYVIANNTHGIIFDGADTAPTITADGEIPGGNAWIYEAQVYYVRDNGTGTPQLSRKILAWNGAAMAFTTEDLVEGIENMSLLFGMDSDADGEIDIYRTAANVPLIEWNNIGAVEINILVRSNTIDPQYTDTKTYNLGGGITIATPGDNYHRMVMQSTVSLRNPKFIIRGNL